MIRTSVQALQKILQPDPNQTGNYLDLQQRTADGITQRNAASDASGVDRPWLSHEQMDPNMGTMSMLSQALRDIGKTGSSFKRTGFLGKAMQ